jgi:hypothetical protein
MRIPYLLKSVASISTFWKQLRKYLKVKLNGSFAYILTHVRT